MLLRLSLHLMLLPSLPALCPQRAFWQMSEICNPPRHKKGLPERVGQAKCPSVVLGRHGRLDHPGHRDRVCHGLHWALAQDADLRLVLAHLVLARLVLARLVSDHRAFHRDQGLQALVLALDRAQVLDRALDPGRV